MYKYETHLHTSPVSRCAHVTVRESLLFYKSIGYAGVFITNHFIDGSIGIERDRPFAERLDFYFSAYDEGLSIGREIGLDVFLGIESSYKGTDFLIYGLPKEWYYAHPDIETLDRRAFLSLLMDAGALVIQAHPYREAGYIDHIRLYPRNVHGIEIYNANRTELENKMAAHYAEMYGLLPFYGSDNHWGAAQKTLAGMMTKTPLLSEEDFVRRVFAGECETFCDTYAD